MSSSRSICPRTQSAALALRRNFVVGPCHYGNSTYQGGLSLPGSGVTSDASKVQKRLSDARQVDPVKF